MQKKVILEKISKSNSISSEPVLSDLLKLAVAAVGVLLGFFRFLYSFSDSRIIFIPI